MARCDFIGTDTENFRNRGVGDAGVARLLCRPASSRLEEEGRMKEWNIDSEIVRSVCRVIMTGIAAWALISFEMTGDGKFSIKRNHAAAEPATSSCQEAEFSGDHGAVSSGGG